MLGKSVQKFRNVFGKAKKKEECYDGFKLKVTGSNPPTIAINNKFAALLCVGYADCDIVIRPLEKVGRFDHTSKGIKASECHVSCMQWSNRDDNVLAVGLTSGEAKFFNVPDGGYTESVDSNAADITLKVGSAVLGILFHPSAADLVLVSDGSQFGGQGSADATYTMWNIKTQEECFSLTIPQCHMVCSSFNTDGSRIVCTDNNHITRVIELRSQEILQEGKCHSRPRRQNSVYLKEGLILTTGYGGFGDREYALFSEDDLDTPLQKNSLDRNSGVLYPIYDPDVNMLYIWGKGDSNIHYLEVCHGEKPEVKTLDYYTSNTPQAGVFAGIKRGVNIELNELMTLYKVMIQQNGTTLMEVIPFVYPRREQGFSLDVYPPTPGLEAALTADQWINGEDSEPAMINLSTGERFTAAELDAINNKGDGLVKTGSVRKTNSVVPSNQEMKKQLNSLRSLIVDFPASSAGLAQHQEFVGKLRAVLNLTAVESQRNGGHGDTKLDRVDEVPKVDLRKANTPEEAGLEIVVKAYRESNKEELEKKEDEEDEHKEDWD